jgi:hypothetical protein
MQKTFSQSDCSSLIKYAWNLSDIELERGTCVPSSTSKFHQNSIIPSEDIMRKTFSQLDCSSLIRYARNLSHIKLQRGTYVPSITSKFHQNPTIPSEDIMQKTFSKSDCSSLIKYTRHLSNLSEGLIYYVSQASFIKIPPLLKKISCRKHSANQIAAVSLNMHRICRASNLSKGFMY